jgi:hypothetical protein
VRAADAALAPPALARRLRHRPTCPRPDVRWYVGNEGDVTLRCAVCAHYFITRDVMPSSLEDGVVRYRALADRDPRPVAPPPIVGPSLICVRCDRPFSARPNRRSTPLCPDCRDQASRRHGRSQEADRGWA